MNSYTLSARFTGITHEDVLPRLQVGKLHGCPFQQILVIKKLVRDKLSIFDLDTVSSVFHPTN